LYREKVDKLDWKRHSAPAVVNAFYSSIENSIQFPAGILQVIFFIMHCEENPIYVLPEKKLRDLTPNLLIHVSMSVLYVPTFGPPKKYIYIESTTVYVPSLELGLTHPFSHQRVCPSPQNQRVGHTRLRVRGWGSPNSDDWRKSFALCLLCGPTYFFVAE
jgi:hypothetical protein